MLVVTMVVCVIGLANANCVIDDSVKDKKTQTENLHILDPIIGQRSDFNDHRGNDYSFKVCEDVSPKFSNVSIIKTTEPKEILGYNNQTLVTRGRNWLMLTFLGGMKDKMCNDTQRQAHILFVCDHHQQNKVQAEMLDDSKSTLSCSLTFIVLHSAVCSPSSEGLSGGAIFFIILLVIFGSYFCFGFFYLRLVKGAKGVEQIPNREFWFKVGNMLADGCSAVLRCDRYCGAASTASSYGGYSPIDERLAQDLQNSDRDSALLSP